MASMLALTRSSSALVATSGIMISGITPIRRCSSCASIAPSKIARACISAISGKAMRQTAAAKAEHRIELMQFAARGAASLSGDHARSAAATSAISASVLRQKFMQRRIEQADRHRQAGHDLEELGEIAALHRQKLGERGAAALLVIGQDHLAHGDDAVGFEEHMFGAAEADAFGAEFARHRARRPASRHWRARPCGARCRPSP